MSTRPLPDLLRDLDTLLEVVDLERDHGRGARGGAGRPDPEPLGGPPVRFADLPEDALLKALSRALDATPWPWGFYRVPREGKGHGTHRAYVARHPRTFSSEDALGDSLEQALATVLLAALENARAEALTGGPR